MFIPPPVPDENEPPTRQRATKIARTLLDGGLSPLEVENKLVERDLDRAMARSIVDEVRTVVATPAPITNTVAKGGANMFYGACWFFGGVAVSIVSYAAAGPGGSYIVATGAVGTGFIQFLYGMFQSMAADQGPDIAAPTPNPELAPLDDRPPLLFNDRIVTRTIDTPSAKLPPAIEPAPVDEQPPVLLNDHAVTHDDQAPPADLAPVASGAVRLLLFVIAILGLFAILFSLIVAPK